MSMAILALMNADKTIEKDQESNRSTARTRGTFRVVPMLTEVRRS
jgi:hypothetical protein